MIDESTVDMFEEWKREDFDKWEARANKCEELGLSPGAFFAGTVVNLAALVAWFSMARPGFEPAFFEVLKQVKENVPDLEH